MCCACEEKFGKTKKGWYDIKMQTTDETIRRNVERLLLLDLHENYAFRMKHLRGLCVGDGVGFMSEKELSAIWDDGERMPNWMLLLLVTIKSAGGVEGAISKLEAELQAYSQQTQNSIEEDEDRAPGSGGGGEERQAAFKGRVAPVVQRRPVAESNGEPDYRANKTPPKVRGKKRDGDDIKDGTAFTDDRRGDRRQYTQEDDKDLRAKGFK